MQDQHTWIREVSVRYTGTRKKAPGVISGPSDVLGIAEKFIRLDEGKEVFGAILLDGRHRPVGFTTITVGTLTSSLVHPRETFRPALVAGAAAIILVHNHPSGDVKPSREDVDVTTRLRKVGDLIGVPVLDHVVVAEGGSYHSIREDDSRWL